ncbi:hypothetical protein GA0115255_104745 [Streptomyces sp. Ncost-T6T-2b]|nr:hypothetical protein GA0115255_104745 [Streptomyces sp. Ncost-T6T-2b]
MERTDGEPDASGRRRIEPTADGRRALEVWQRWTSAPVVKNKRAEAEALLYARAVHAEPAEPKPAVADGSGQPPVLTARPRSRPRITRCARPYGTISTTREVRRRPAPTAPPSRPTTRPKEGTRA